MGRLVQVGARTIQIRLPGVFWNDHADRGCASGEFIRNRGAQVEIRCAPEELAEIYSDAEYYAGHIDQPPHVIASAKRTVKAIDAFRARVALSPRSEHGAVPMLGAYEA